MGTGEYLSVKAENELKIKNSESESDASQKKGIVMFFSFILFGMIL